MQNEDESITSSRSPLKVLGATGFLLFALYTDIFALQIPLFAFICPAVFVVLAAFWLLRRLSPKVVLLRLVLGFPLVLIATSVLSFVLSQMHDRWLMNTVRTWGAELRSEKAATGHYPKSVVKSFHGYPAVFINNDSPHDTPSICVHKFAQMRQCYSVPDDRFLEEIES